MVVYRDNWTALKYVVVAKGGKKKRGKTWKRGCYAARNLINCSRKLFRAPKPLKFFDLTSPDRKANAKVTFHFATAIVENIRTLRNSNFTSTFLEQFIFYMIQRCTEINFVRYCFFFQIFIYSTLYRTNRYIFGCMHLTQCIFAASLNNLWGSLDLRLSSLRTFNRSICATIGLLHFSSSLLISFALRCHNRRWAYSQLYAQRIIHKRARIVEKFVFSKEKKNLSSHPALVQTLIITRSLSLSADDKLSSTKVYTRVSSQTLHFQRKKKY